MDLTGLVIKINILLMCANSGKILFNISQWDIKAPISLFLNSLRHNITYIIFITGIFNFLKNQKDCVRVLLKSILSPIWDGEKKAADLPTM